MGSGPSCGCAGCALTCRRADWRGPSRVGGFGRSQPMQATVLGAPYGFKMSTSSHWGMTPRQSVEQECGRRGRSSVVQGCVDLLNAESVDDDLVLALGGLRRSGSGPATLPDRPTGCVSGRHGDSCMSGTTRHDQPWFIPSATRPGE